MTAMSACMATGGTDSHVSMIAMSACMATGGTDLMLVTSMLT